MSPRRDDITVSDFERGDQPRIVAEPKPRYSHSLELGLATLECFTAERTALGVFELADLLDTSRPTAFRYATTHLVLGNLEKRGRRYSLASGACDPGARIIATLKGELKARAVLERLRNQTGHTVTLGVLHDTRVVLIECLYGHGRGQYDADHGLGVGANVPTHCTALGKVLLASLGRKERKALLARMTLTRYGPKTIVRKKQLASAIEAIAPNDAVTSDEELFSGTRSIAALVPRALPYGHAAAIEVTVPSAACTLDRLALDIGPLVTTAAKAL